MSEISLDVEDEIPKRKYMDDPNTEWRYGTKPDYTLVNELFLKERRIKHPPGSMERMVQDLVKTWEMEVAHKHRAKVQWKPRVYFTPKLLPVSPCDIVRAVGAGAQKK